MKEVIPTATIAELFTASISGEDFTTEVNTVTEKKVNLIVAQLAPSHLNIGRALGIRRVKLEATYTTTPFYDFFVSITDPDTAAKVWAGFSFLALNSADLQAQYNAYRDAVRGAHPYFTTEDEGDVRQRELPDNLTDPGLHPTSAVSGADVVTTSVNEEFDPSEFLLVNLNFKSLVGLHATPEEEAMIAAGMLVTRPMLFFLPTGKYTSGDLVFYPRYEAPDPDNTAISIYLRRSPADERWVTNERNNIVGYRWGVAIKINDPVGVSLPGRPIRHAGVFIGTRPRGIQVLDFVLGGRRLNGLNVGFEQVSNQTAFSGYAYTKGGTAATEYLNAVLTPTPGMSGFVSSVPVDYQFDPGPPEIRYAATFYKVRREKRVVASTLSFLGA